MFATLTPESDYPKRLIGNWEIVYGTYTLANNANVDEAFVSNVDKFDVPSSCSITVYLSNNHGTSWETYDTASTDAHVFSSTGNQLRVKISASGHPDKSPYYMGFAGPLSVHYKSLHSAAKDANVKFKVTRKKLRS